MEDREKNRRISVGMKRGKNGARHARSRRDQSYSQVIQSVSTVGHRQDQGFYVSCACCNELIILDNYFLTTGEGLPNNYNNNNSIYTYLYISFI